jgi:hypothetical protein
MKPFVLLCSVAALNLTSPLFAAAEEPFRDKFSVATNDWTSTGGNLYFKLEPGYTLVLEGKEEGRVVALTITVLDETLRIDGVETRVVEEREKVNEQLVEVSRNYLAASKRSGDVYYFGEDVDTYNNGELTGHGGSWRARVNGARFGLMVPAKPYLGQRYYQELAGNVAQDRAEVVSLTETAQTAAGAFANCLKTVETTPLEPLSKEYKVYAPGVGLVQDGNLVLTRYGRPAK